MRFCALFSSVSPPSAFSLGLWGLVLGLVGFGVYNWVLGFKIRVFYIFGVFIMRQNVLDYGIRIRIRIKGNNIIYLYIYLYLIYPYYIDTQLYIHIRLFRLFGLYVGLYDCLGFIRFYVYNFRIFTCILCIFSLLGIEIGTYRNI